MSEKDILKTLGQDRKFRDLTDERLQKINKLEAAIAVASNLEQEAKRLLSLAQKAQTTFHDVLDEAAIVSASILDEEDYVSEVDTETFYLRANGIINDMYQDATATYRNRNIFDPEIERRTEEIFKISAQFLNGNIIVQAPLLTTQWGNNDKGMHGFHRYGKIFSEEIWFAVERISKQIPQEILSKFSMKTFNYFFNFDSDFPFVSDADNKDTKAITDAIADHFRYSDSTFTCSFSYTNIHKRSLPTATFVVVSPGIFNFKTPDVLDRFHPI